MVLAILAIAAASVRQDHMISRRSVVDSGAYLGYNSSS
jgi:hypothetical protein